MKKRIVESSSHPTKFQIVCLKSRLGKTDNISMTFTNLLKWISKVGTHDQRNCTLSKT